MINQDDFLFADNDTDIECMLRGIYVSFSCELEYILSEIITICLVDNKENEEDFKIILLEKTTLGKKLELVSKTLRHFNSDIFDKYEWIFNNQKKVFLFYRNLMAHSMIRFSRKDNNLDVVRIRYIKDCKIVTESFSLIDLKQKFTDCQLQCSKLFGLIGDIKTIGRKMKS